MRILYLTPYVPSPVRVRPYQLIRHLAALGHEVTLICLAGRAEEPQALAELRRVCREVVAVPTSRIGALRATVRALPSALPLQAAYGSSPELVRAALVRAGACDVVQIEHLRGASYGAALRGYTLVLDAVDCISLLFERAIRQSPSLPGRARALLDLARTRRAEGRYGATYPQVVVTSPEDAWALERLQQAGVPAPEIEVVSNGVDLETFTPGDEHWRLPATLVLSGKMSYHANEAAVLWMGREIMPLIWRERRDVQLLIVGRDPTRRVQALAADPRITVTGGVPALAPYLHTATLAVAPLRYGVGVQNKVLEAMATGTAVVTTPQAVRALDAIPGHDLEVASTAEGLAATVLELLASPARRARLGMAGRRYVERHHTWDRAATQLLSIYRRARTPPAADGAAACRGHAATRTGASLC